MRCWFRHAWGWPRLNRESGATVETCADCGATRAAKESLATNPRFDVPRFMPVAVEAESARQRVVKMKKVK